MTAENIVFIVNSTKEYKLSAGHVQKIPKDSLLGKLLDPHQNMQTKDSEGRIILTLDHPEQFSNCLNLIDGIEIDFEDYKSEIALRQMMKTVDYLQIEQSLKESNDFKLLELGLECHLYDERRLAYEKSSNEIIRNIEGDLIECIKNYTKNRLSYTHRETTLALKYDTLRKNQQWMLEMTVNNETVIDAKGEQFFSKEYDRCALSTDGTDIWVNDL